MLTGKVKTRRSFTLIELMIVIGVIILLIGISLSLYSLAGRKAMESKTEAMIRKMCIALEAYKTRTGYYIQQSTWGALYIDNYTDPTGTVTYEVTLNDFISIPDEELGAKRGQRPSFSANGDPNAIERQTDRGSWKDPFERDFLYRCPGIYNRGSFDLYSAGEKSSHAGTREYY